MKTKTSRKLLNQFYIEDWNIIRKKVIGPFVKQRDAQVDNSTMHQIDIGCIRKISAILNYTMKNETLQDLMAKYANEN